MTKAIIASITAIVILTSSCLAGEVLWEDSIPQGRIESRLALTLGTPAGINFCESFWGEKVTGTRITLGFLPGAEGSYMWGGQLEVLFKAYEKSNTICDFSLGAGYSDMRLGGAEHRWAYGGGFFTLNSKSFFLQTGLTFGHDNNSTYLYSPDNSAPFPNPELFLQIGFSLTTTRRK